MKIKPLLETTLAEDVPAGPQGQPSHKKGATVVFSSLIKTKKFGSLAIVTPNPVFCYLNKAENLIQSINQQSEDIKKSMQNWAMFSAIDKNPSEFIKSANKDSFNNFVENSSLIPILLFSSVEAFINQVIPESFIYLKSKKKIFFIKRVIKLNKSDIVRQIGTEEKLCKILKQIFNKDIKNEPLWDEFRKLKILRDEIIHLKQRSNQYLNSYNHIFISLIDADYMRFFENVKSTIEFFKPDFFKK